MRKHDQKCYPLEPQVKLGDYQLLRWTSWSDIDHRATELLGKQCLGVPSVRVGMSWALEYLGCRRYRDHVLVPRFMGRCILNSLNRLALPVENLTKQTRLVVVVHQYGLKQRLEFIAKECSSNGLPLIEDSPFGLEAQEELAAGSLAKFIGLSKILPVLKGSLVISNDPSFLGFITRKREEFSLWSWFVFAGMAYLRMRRKSSSYSSLADAVYEMYVPSKGDNNWLRGNVRRALEQLNSLAVQSNRRLSMIKDQLMAQVLIPDTDRMTYIVPYFPGNDLERVQKVFRVNRFASSLYHVDVARNLFNPRYEKALLIPLNPRIPFAKFQALLNGLATKNVNVPHPG